MLDRATVALAFREKALRTIHLGGQINGLVRGHSLCESDSDGWGLVNRSGGL